MRLEKVKVGAITYMVPTPITSTRYHYTSVGGGGHDKLLKDKLLKIKTPEFITGF